MALIAQPNGNYQFAPRTSNTPYSIGVVASPGYEIVHAVLQTPLPYREGFAKIERHLAERDRPRAALCAVELRCAAPYRPQDWLAPGGFNAQYEDLLRGWGLFVDGENPVARTNIAPGVNPPGEQVLYAFSYTIPTADTRGPATFVAAGAAELEGTRTGDRSPTAMREKTQDVLATVGSRLSALGKSWTDTTSVGVYTVEEIQPFLADVILAALGPAAVHGIHWYYGRPPISDREIEIDARGVRMEIRV
jgi:hypothetical protein